MLKYEGEAMCNIIPRVAAIHDLSGFGRCSLTVIIPVLSTMGIQVCPLPTAVLSTHTGGFENFYFNDLTDEMDAYAKHWKELDLQFDCIYTGYLGSIKQVDIVLNIIKLLKSVEKQLIVVDPVMGDDGELYSTFTVDMQHKMRELVHIGNIITPNLTEAAFLLNKPYPTEPLDLKEIKYYLRALSELGPDKVVITSVKTVNGQHCNAGYTKSTDTYFIVPYTPVPASYPGTGDIFASVLTGCLLKHDTLTNAVISASNFAAMASAETYKYRTTVREGVLLETVLPVLTQRIDSKNFEII